MFLEDVQSPDGQWLVFLGGTEEGFRELYRMRVDGSDFQNLSQSPDAHEEEWPALSVTAPAQWDDIADPARLRQVWSGAVEDDYAAAVITSTAAVPLKLAGRATSFDEALALARRLWDERPRERVA